MQIVQCVCEDLTERQGSEVFTAPLWLQEEAFDIADEIVVFNRGLIEQAGRREELLQRPATPFVMQFVSDTNSLAAIHPVPPPPAPHPSPHIVKREPVVVSPVRQQFTHIECKMFGALSWKQYQGRWNPVCCQPLLQVPWF